MHGLQIDAPTCFQSKESSKSGEQRDLQAQPITSYHVRDLYEQTIHHTILSIPSGFCIPHTSSPHFYGYKQQV
jgi:hypothetical protein